MTRKNVTVGVYGLGRFGLLAAGYLAQHTRVLGYDRQPLPTDRRTEEIQIVGEAQLLKESDYLLLAVPISSLEGALKDIDKHLGERRPVVIDTCSVKVEPARLMKEILPPGTPIIATHPLFGPDSAGLTLDGQMIVTWNVSASSARYNEVLTFLRDLGLTTLEMAPLEHDRQAAESQGLTHFLGRVMEAMDVEPGPADTLGTRLLHQVREQTCNDTRELFQDLQRYNPFCLDMRRALRRAMHTVEKQIIPDRVDPTQWVVGIQGRRGSFNEEAVLRYIAKERIANPHIIYLVTTHRVLKALSDGKIDRGIFAVQNSNRGMVVETFQALTAYNCFPVADFWMRVVQCLITRDSIALEDITEVHSHPQALGQCVGWLRKNLPWADLVEGEDTADCALHLSQNRLSKTTAVIGSMRCVDHYPGLHVVAENIADDPENITQFIIVKRR